jgi:hypothetical protein
MSIINIDLQRILILDFYIELYINISQKLIYNYIRINKFIINILFYILKLRKLRIELCKTQFTF